MRYLGLRESAGPVLLLAGWRRVVSMCVLALLLVSVALCPASVFAQIYAPWHEWEQLETPHFRVTYHEGLTHQAQAVAVAAERAWGEVTEALAFEPATPIEVILADETDSANGSATVLPYNIIRLNAATPPDVADLSDYADWYTLLVAHELVHIVHLQTTDSWPLIINTLFGRRYAPNGQNPRWLTEGIATYFETALTGRGRVHSSYFDMLLRLAVLGDEANWLPDGEEHGLEPTSDGGGLLDLGEFSAGRWKWPQGSIPYLYGGRFFDYIARRFGEDTLAKVSHDYGARLIPFAINTSLKRATKGHTYSKLLRDFEEELRTRYRQQLGAVRAAGRREGTLLTVRGQRHVGPRRHPGGDVFYVEAPVGGHALVRVLRMNPAGQVIAEPSVPAPTVLDDEVIARVRPDARVAVSPSGEQVAVTQIENNEVYFAFGDLYAVDVNGGEAVRKTHGLRAVGIDFCGENQVVFARRQANHSHIAMLDWPVPEDWESRVKVAATLGPDTQAFDPRCSPDGRWVAFSGMRAGQRDIYLAAVPLGDSVSASPIVEAEVEPGQEGESTNKQPLLQLTDHSSQAGGPSFTPDGKWILFHSDYGGIFNLYAMPAPGLGPGTEQNGFQPVLQKAKSWRRLSQVVGGAFYPEALTDNKVVYQAYGREGFDLALLNSSIDAAPLVTPQPAAEASDVALAPAAVPAATQSESKSYTPWATLLPRSWWPTVTEDADGAVVGVRVNGGDVVGHHRYSLSTSYSVGNRFWSGQGVYSNFQFHPGITLSANRRLGSTLAAYIRDRRAQRVDEAIWTMAASMRWPLVRLREWGISLGMRYEMQFRDMLEPLRFGPFEAAPVFPDSGRFASFGADLTYTTAQGYLGSITAEEGLTATVGANVEGPWLGSEYQSWSVSGSVTQYIENPWWPRHVLKLRLFAGYGDSNYRRPRQFAVAGLPRTDFFYDALRNRRRGGGGSVLRGLDNVAFIGDALVSAGVEYRFPIWDPLRGYDTWPVFIRGIEGALFSDAAAIEERFRVIGRGQHYTVGGELRVTAVLGYDQSVMLRLGFGQAVVKDNDRSFFVLLSTPLR